jgi:hypothetical protein
VVWAAFEPDREPGTPTTAAAARVAMAKVNLAEKLSLFTEHWSPKIVGEVRHSSFIEKES